MPIPFIANGADLGRFPTRHANGLTNFGLMKKALSLTWKGKPNVKKKSKIHKVMGEYKRGTLRSGSKRGPKVKSRRQAIAIAMSESRRGKK
jgi:hypothetical protein